MDFFTGVALQYHITDVSQALYPCVRWLYIESYKLFALFLLAGVVLGLADRYTDKMRFVGLNSKAVSDYRRKYYKDNETAAPYATLASLDSPPKAVTARRHLHHYGYLLLVWFLGWSVCVFGGRRFSPVVGRVDNAAGTAYLCRLVFAVSGQSLWGGVDSSRLYRRLGSLPPAVVLGITGLVCPSGRKN